MEEEVAPFSSIPHFKGIPFTTQAKGVLPLGSPSYGWKDNLVKSFCLLLLRTLLQKLRKIFPYQNLYTFLKKNLPFNLCKKNFFL